jgi:hypothetical protein
MPLPKGNPLNVDVGPGRLWRAKLTATQPTNATTALVESEDDGADGEWVPAGYTETGSTFGYEVTAEPIEVAEELDEIRNQRTKALTKVTFAFAEMTATNLLMALNGGIDDSPTAIEPVDAEDEERIMLCFQSDAGARWLFRRCYNVGSVSIENKKAPAKRLIGVEFKAEIPETGKAWTAWPNAAGLV